MFWFRILKTFQNGQIKILILLNELMKKLTGIEIIDRKRDRS